MNHFLINNYIKKITKQDIYNFALNQNIILTNSELDTLYYYLKNKSKEFLSSTNNQIELLKEIKPQLNPLTFNKIEELYYLYKDKL